MKKTFLAISILLALLVASCTKKESKSVELASEADSLSYAFGYAKGLLIRNYEIKNASDEMIDMFVNSFRSAIFTDEDMSVKEVAIFAHAINMQFAEGFLFSDASLPLDKQLIATSVRSAVEGTAQMSRTAADEYLTLILSQAATNGLPIGTSPERIDSLHVAFGVVQGWVINELLPADATPALRSEAIDAFDASFLGIHSSNNMEIRGLDVALSINKSMQGANYVFNDSTLLFNRDLFVQAVEDAVRRQTPVFASQYEVNRYIEEREGISNARKGAQPIVYRDQFLQENAQREGVITTASGLQYEVIAEGTGAHPTTESIVKVDYEGWLTDGTKFDSSIDRGVPAEFPLNRVIRGWTEGLQLMTPGAKYRFYIPYNLAYGENGTQGIPPYATLIFDVTLYDIK